MKVAFCIRPDWKSSHGGDGVQLVKTIEALEVQHGLDASIVTDPSDSALSRADLVHVFNIQTAEISLEFARAAKKSGRPIALSTIYWDLSHARFIDAMGARIPRPSWKPLKAGFDAFGRLTAATVGRPRYLTRYRREAVRELLHAADVLLPNSAEEGQIVAREFDAHGIPAIPVVNAIDASKFSTPTVNAVRTGVAIVGRIQPIKGQLTVLAALRDRRDTPISIVGARQHPTYSTAVDRAVQAHGNARVVPGMNPEEVAHLLQSTQVHVLPSFRESPGLSTLEALACGARVVVASREYCPIDTYFNELIGSSVFVADPYDPASVRSAIEQAMASQDTADIESWKANFTWKQTARQTYSAYEQVLNS